MLLLGVKQAWQEGIQPQPPPFALIDEAFLHRLVLAMTSSNGFQFIPRLRIFGNEYGSC